MIVCKRDIKSGTQLSEEYIYLEKELLLKAAEGDESAFDVVYEHNWRKVYSYIEPIVKSSETAEEIVTDIFVNLWQSKERLKDIESFCVCMAWRVSNRLIHLSPYMKPFPPIKKCPPLVIRLKYDITMKGFSKMYLCDYLQVKTMGVLNLQKSRDSTKEVIKFTLNFGVYSDVLGKLQYDYCGSGKPHVEQCHWQSRVGNFMPDSPHYWWNVKATDALGSITVNLMETIDTIVIPQLNKRLLDEGVINSCKYI